MGGRGASSGNIGGKITLDGKFVVGNTYRLYSENAGYDHDFVVTNINKETIKGILTERVGVFGRDYLRGKEIEYSKNSIAYNEAKLLKESETNAKARGNRERKEIQNIRKKLDKAGVKHIVGESLEKIKYRYNQAKKIGKIK